MLKWLPWLCCRTLVRQEAFKAAVLEQHVPEPYRDFLSLQKLVEQGPDVALKLAQKRCQEHLHAAKAKSESSWRKYNPLNWVSTRTKDDAVADLNIATVLNRSRQHACMLLRTSPEQVERLESLPVLQQLLKTSARNMWGNIVNSPSKSFDSTKAGVPAPAFFALNRK